MNGIGKQAAFYRGYLPDDRSLFPLMVFLSTTVALWLLVYTIGVAGDAPQGVTSFDSQCCERPEREVTKPSRTPAETSSPDSQQDGPFGSTRSPDESPRPSI